MLLLYVGPKATIEDSVKTYSSSKADFFYVSQVDGAEIENSRNKTLLVNRGRGMDMSPVVLHHDIPARPIALSIVGRTEYAAPILALTSDVYEVKGVIEFTPEPNKKYIVRGELGDTYSAVWVEDESTNSLVDKKVEVKGSAKLGVFDK
ncbi:MAG: hypothetical protein ACLPXB_03725 [Thiobacillaceae bacterium]